LSEIDDEQGAPRVPRLMKIAATGGSGFIGRRLVDALVSQGHMVNVLSRNAESAPRTGVGTIQGDLTRADCPLEEFLRGCEVVYHCAGEVRDTARMRELHVEGTRRLLAAALAEAARQGRAVHWVQLSSVGAYGPVQGSARAERVVTEETPTRPVGEYEITKTVSDELVIRSCKPGLMSYSIVRPSNVFGAGMSNGSLYALGKMVRKGLFFYVGPPGAIAPYVHVDDVVEVLRLCGTEQRAKGMIFNISNDCRLEEMIGGMAAALGARSPRMRLPERLVRLAVRVMSLVAPLPLTQARIDALVGRTRYPCRKLERELGFIPRRDVPGAMAELLPG
jgi:nucleoside-diphosphate-sugar epimerase